MDSVRSEFIGAQHRKVKQNLDSGEREALEELLALQDQGIIVMQPGDKNAGICIMNKDDYVKEAERQLYDTYLDKDGHTCSYYKKVDPKEIDRQFKEVKDVVNEGLQKGYIDEKMHKTLLPPKAQGSKLYLLPKVHKQFEGFPKCRPIVASSGCNTERISWFVDNIVKEKVKSLDSYIEDTPDLLRKIIEINEKGDIPEGAIPISIDIKSMYSNIPLDEGLEAFRECLESRSDELKQEIPTYYIMKLVRLVMEKNIFTFNEECWLQLLGTCMGTRVSPSYANLFMGILEKKLLENCPAHLKHFIYLWKRFIDDILLIWLGSLEEFRDFFNYLNSYHTTIKFDEPCHNQDENSCNFLDLKISIHDGVIHTDLYRKPTDKPRALLPSSAHPNHITTNIVYSMAFRLLRICDSEELFEKRLTELKKDFLMPRNYSSKVVEKQFERIRNLPGSNYSEKRTLALQKKIRNVNSRNANRVKFPFDYHPVLPDAGPVLKKHHRTMITDNPELADPFPDPPMACLRQGRKLRNILCKSTLSKISRNPARATHRSAAGWRRCSTTGGRQCNQCPYTPVSAGSITSHVTGYTHNITQSINCKTERVVYAWKCLKCKINFTVNAGSRAPQALVTTTQQQHNNIKATSYLGNTKRRFSKRLSEHVGYIRSRKTEEPSGEHFNLPGHSQSDIQGLGIEHVRSTDPFILRAREAFLIKKFDSYKNGLNQEP